LYALMRLGFTDEAAGFMTWLEARCREAPAGRGLQVLYAVDGNPEVPESVLDHLEGYKGSQPVRVGNSAAGQLQLDIYGGPVRRPVSVLTGDTPPVHPCGCLTRAPRASGVNDPGNERFIASP
jgi:GH15 family glucan-1,4-alpha-glucosidase